MSKDWDCNGRKIEENSNDFDCHSKGSENISPGGLNYEGIVHVVSEILCMCIKVPQFYVENIFTTNAHLLSFRYCCKYHALYTFVYIFCLDAVVLY